MKNYEKFLLIPYKTNGYDYDGADCYGLCHLIRRELFGKINDPRYDNTGILAQARGCRDADKEGWVRYDEPAEGMVIVMKSECGLTSHVALYIGNDMIIEIDDNGAYESYPRISNRRKEREVAFYD